MDLIRKSPSVQSFEKHNMDSNRSSGASLAIEDDTDIEKGLDNVDLDDNEDIEAQNALSEKVVVAERDPSLVEFDGPDDPGNPKNWTRSRRTLITMAMSLMTFVVTFSSSIFAVAIEPVSKEFDVGTTTATLGVALFLLGFVLGPVMFGPASEVYGRRIPLFAGYIVFAIFNIPVAVARNVETIMLARFFGGLAASAPLAVVGGALADLWNPLERAYGVCGFAAGAFVGPVAGPIVGAFVTESHLGWRWTAWITLILASFFGLIGLAVIPETSASRILQTRATRMRYETRNWALHAKADENQITVETIVNVYLKRPFVMISQEPILALLTGYMSFLYGVLYMLFEAFPVSFHEDRGWSLGISSLPFLSFVIGVMLGVSLILYSTATTYKQAFLKHGRPIPEARLPPMVIGAVVLPIGFFWFGWTSFASITWSPQVISVALLGFGMFVCFWQGMSYIIDVYGPYSNSAIAVNTFIRSIAGACFPLFAQYMYHGMGVPWASSLLGFICLVFVPAPILFIKYGASIRQKSSFKPVG